MSMDSASEPPSSAVSYSLYGGQFEWIVTPPLDPLALNIHTHSHSHSKSGGMDFPFNTYAPNGTLDSGPALRGPIH